MKKLFLFSGVILSCHFFSCKKNDLTPPPPKVDSLPFPLTTGTWWKYQRMDTTITNNPPPIPNIQIYDSSIELITVLGKTPYEVYNRKTMSMDKVEAFMLMVNTFGGSELDYAVYYDSSFCIFPYKSASSQLPYVSIKLPQNERPYYIANGIFYGYSYSNYVTKGISVTVFDKVYDNCILTYFQWYGDMRYGIGGNSETTFKPNVGFIRWKVYPPNEKYFSTPHYYYRRLIDYHIAP